MERQIVAAALQSREAFNRIQSLTNPRDFSDVSAELWRKIARFYEIDTEATSVNIELLKQIVIEEIPRHSDIILLELDSLSETSVPNLLAELTNLKKKKVSEAILTELAMNPTSESVIDLMQEYQSVTVEEVEDVEPASNIAKDILVELANPENQIKLYPAVLNDATGGGAIGGNHILVFARSNAGKTMFTINCVRGMARDGRRVLHLINEEPRKQLLLRYINRCSGLTKREVYADIDAAIARAKESGLDNIYIEDINPGTFAEVRGLIEKIKPDVVVLDQLRNMTVKEESRVNGLEKLATEARNLAKRYGIVVISVTQAGDSATNKLVLTESDIDSSKTGIPAQCDLILGLGVNDEQKHQQMRTLTIVKNKIENIHEYYPVRVDENLSKIVSM